MNRRIRVAFCRAFIVLCLTPSAAVAQSLPQPPVQAPSEAGPSNIWLAAGAAFATLRGDCQTCEEDFPYRHAASFLANIGYRLHNRMDVGAEVFWLPVTTDAGDRIRTTHLDAVAQFRPWASKGFFVKGGAGVAFVRNWVDVPDAPPVTSKALSVVIGGGWAFRTADRFGVQVFAAQHAAALGDLQTSTSDIQDVIGNFWSVGVAVVVR